MLGLPYIHYKKGRLLIVNKRTLTKKEFKKEDTIVSIYQITVSLPHGYEIQSEKFFKHLFHYGQVVQNFGAQVLEDTLKFNC